MDSEKEVNEFDKYEAGLPTEERRLAIYLHKELCNNGKEIECDWFFESIDGKYDWQGQTHLRYIKLAKKILSIFNYGEAVKILDFISELD